MINSRIIFALNDKLTVLSWPTSDGDIHMKKQNKVCSSERGVYIQGKIPEGPARTTAALILHWAHNPSLSPIFLHNKEKKNAVVQLSHSIAPQSSSSVGNPEHKCGSTCDLCFRIS